MTPFEAKLAGGAFAYEVVTYKARWPNNANSLKAMWAQSIQADNSGIWMMFNGSLQYPGGKNTSFRVCFE